LNIILMQNNLGMMRLTPIRKTKYYIGTST
jgi:hypothetical protein